MDCAEVSKILFLFVDNEMDGELLILCQEHVVSCPGCTEKIDYTRKLLWVVRERCVRCTAPRTLRQRILTSLPHRRPDVTPL